MLKLKIIEGYNARLDERLKRREFVVEHKLLDSHYQITEKGKLGRISNRLFQPFMRFAEKHEQFRGIVDADADFSKYEYFLKSSVTMRRKVDPKGNLNQIFEFLKTKRIKILQKKEK